jgi:integrase
VETGLPVKVPVNQRVRHFSANAGLCVPLVANTVNSIRHSLINMSDDMTEKFRLFRRASGVWYIEDKETREQESLRIRDAAEARRLFHAKNEAYCQPAINVQIARAYLTASDPMLVTRTWQDVMESLIKQKKGTNHLRWKRAINDKSFESIRQLPLIETRSDHFLNVLEKGKVSSNVYLRRIHNFALAMDWLLKPVIPKATWPKVSFKVKRAITADEHRRITERERNPERRALYNLCWHLGGSQMDVANLTAEDIDWDNRTICYQRAKLKSHQNNKIRPPLVHFGEEVAVILRSLPQSGPLFPKIRGARSSDRGNEFRQRCHGLGIKGVSLHCYRNSWAERARKCGYPQRYAQEALGHNSKAVHQAYAKRAEVEVPSLDEWEKQMSDKVIQLKTISFRPLTELETGRP